MSIKNTKSQLWMIDAIEKTFDFYFLSKDDREIYLPQLFEILATNMNEIAPTGDSAEQDYQIWKAYIIPALDHPERKILLIKQKDNIIGYFQYSLSKTTFMMEELEIKRKFWSSGAFQALYKYIAMIIPKEITVVEAYANRSNLKSQAILHHLGLNVTETSKNGRSYHYVGDCQKMLEKYWRI